MAKRKKTEFKPGPNDAIVSLYDDADFKDLRYGRWRDDKNGHYFLPEHLSGSDYSGGLVARANFNAWSELYGEGEDKWWTNAAGGHGTFAVVIDVDKVPEDISEDVAETLGSLYDYPLLDEDEHSRLEMEGAYEAWKDWAEGDFKKKLEKALSSQVDKNGDKREVDLDYISDGRLYEIFQKASEKANEYWAEDGDGGKMYINLDRIISKLSEASLEAVRKFLDLK